MEFIQRDTIASLSNPGVVSRQLLNPDNSASARGSGRPLLAGGAETEFNAGDVVRFEDGDIHGLRNDGEVEFIYLSVTAPPIHFGYAYQNNNSEKG